MFRLLMIGYTLLAVGSCALAQEDSIAKSLGKGDVAKSPSGRASCFVDYSGKDWNDVKVRFCDGKTLTIWKSVRSVGVSWSPNEKYFAIEDYLDRIATAVLVFKLDQEGKRADLIYQTPYSNSVFVQYEAVGWLDGGFALQIGKFDPKTRRVESKEVVQLVGLQPIRQTIYPSE